jgi:hypothetical protein
MCLAGVGLPVAYFANQVLVSDSYEFLIFEVNR